MNKAPGIALMAILFFTACHSQGPQVTTFAGNGTLGYVDGKVADASFSNPMGLAVDSLGNIYVADSRNNVIRKISAGGIVTTLAGSGKVGSADGKGNAATFFFPTALTVDIKGTVYVADTHNNLVRKITPGGVVTTLAGRYTPANGVTNGDIERFDNPSGIAVDKHGTVYITDWAKDKVKKIGPDGKVSTIAGTGNPGSADGPGASAAFFLPEGIATDAKGNLYVADTYNNRVRKITPQGVVSTLVTGKVVPQQGRSKRDTAALSHPFGIAVDDAGNIYVADAGNNKIRKITPAGKMGTLAGSGLRGLQNGAANIASFYNPFGVALDSKGNLYIADYQNNLIRKITL